MKAHTDWDRFEMWAGVRHDIDLPDSRHQLLGANLIVALAPASRARGLIGTYATLLFRPGFDETDFRIPDLVYTTEERRAYQGVEGRAELVIEIRSPRDESYEKIPFYAEMGCQEVLVLDQDMLALVLFLQGERQPEADGYDLASLDVRVERIDGPQLAVTWQGDTTVITPFPT